MEDNEIIDLIKGKEKSPMEDWIQRMKETEKKRQSSLEKRAIERGLKKGMKQGITQGIKNMLKENQEDDTIIRFIM